MPYKKNYSRKKSSRKSRKMIRYSTPNVVPDKKVCKLRYVQTIPLDPSVQTASNWVFRANSLFDPDYTGTGHQPLGFDEMALFYDHYIVIGSKITAKFISIGSGSTTNCCMVGVRLNDSSTVTASYQTVMEQANNRYKFLSNSGALQSQTCTKTYSPRKFFGIKDINDNRSLLGASMSANPNEDAMFHVYAAPFDTATNPAALNVLVTIEYIAVFSERKSLLSS